MSNVLDRYNALVAAGELQCDPAQADAAARLAVLQAALETVPRNGSLLWRLTKRKPEAPRGVYLWGGVGRGKSMLMDAFYDCLDIGRKRRVHFHEFMIEVHARIRMERERTGREHAGRQHGGGDPIAPVAAAMAEQWRALAFDEMVVNNPADAMIMSRLFTALIDRGVTMVTTSNRPPSDLYKDGLNREHFLPFIALIAARLDVIALDGPTDYRMARLAGIDSWHTPLGPEATEATREAFFRLTDFASEDAANVPSAEMDLGGGRMLHVPKSLKGVAVFSFRRLCGEARGAPDYLAIARRYHSVILVGIPRLGPENRNEAARFVTLIDALYEYKVKLIATAAVEPEDLYKAGDANASGAFEFQRTVSRLHEMQSDEYRAKGHGATT